MASTDLDAPFWDALAEGELQLSRCATCDRWSWPPQPRCGECGSFEVRWEPVDPVGSVFSWTRSWYGFSKDLADQVPYTVVVAELPQAGGTRVIGVVVGPDEEIAIGQSLHGEIVRTDADDPASARLRWRLT